MSSRARACAAGVGLFAALGLACAELQPPQAAVHVVVAGELRPQADFDRLRVRVETPDGALLVEELVEGEALHPLPHRFNFLSGRRTGPGAKLVLAAEAQRGGATVSGARGEVTLVPGVETLELRLGPAAAKGCVTSLDCAARESCLQGRCQVEPAVEGACTSDGQCQSGRCRGGRCCPPGGCPLEAPVNQTAPSVQGVLEDGRTAVAEPGQWTSDGPVAFAFAWGRCEPQGGACTWFEPSPEPSRLLSADDVGLQLTVQVTATNDGGTTVARSPLTQPVGAAGPLLVLAPTLQGVPADGAVLTAQPGTWSGTAPIAFEFEWQQCDGAGACSPLPGQVGTSLTLSEQQVGASVRVAVTARNRGGALTATSAPSAVVAGPPVSIAPPAVVGTPSSGTTLSVDPGTWAGSTPMSLAQEWLRCDATGGACNSISGATGTTRSVPFSDLGRTYRVRVKATNAAGSATAVSAPTAAVFAVSVERKATWKYLDSGAAPASGWVAAGFTETGWKSGRGILGYGDSYVDTAVSYGPSSSAKYVTTYFRRTFQVSDPSRVSAMLAEVMYDDGFVMYVNGTEVYRQGLPAGAVSFGSLAAAHEANQTYEPFDLSAAAGLLVPGTNQLAVEVHQQSAGSSDLVFDLGLRLE